MFQRATDFILDTCITVFAVALITAFMVVMVVVLAIGDAVSWLFGKRQD